MSFTTREEMIERNSARCMDCGDEIESTHRHDWVQCSCRAIFVDGGREYRRFGWTEGARYESTSIYDVHSVTYDDQLREVGREFVERVEP